MRDLVEFKARRYHTLFTRLNKNSRVFLERVNDSFDFNHEKSHHNNIIIIIIIIIHHVIHHQGNQKYCGFNPFFAITSSDLVSC